MSRPETGDGSSRPAPLVSIHRLATTLGLACVGGLMLSPRWHGGPANVILTRTAPLGLLAMLTFGLFERWPRRLPAWLARWVLQVVSVGISVPLGAFALYQLGTPADGPHFWQIPQRLTGFVNVSLLGVLLAPWVALGALVRQREALARHQARDFALERSEFERQALDARLRLVQAQVTPHFLFNTLSNVQALVDMQSPMASQVLRSLIVYLRAAVPRLERPVATLGEELDLARAYLELMHMRMPDRLSFFVDVEPAAMRLRCPPLSVLTLVENAVRHGIDPSEVGGSVRVEIRRRGDHCIVRVTDTGVGVGPSDGGLGTGLAALRERLRLMYGDAAALSLVPVAPNGACAELRFPALEHAEARA